MWPWVPSIQKARADELSPLLVNPTAWQSRALVQTAHTFHCMPLGCLMLPILLPRPTCCGCTELVWNVLVVYSRSRLPIRSLNPTLKLLKPSIWERAQEAVFLGFGWVGGGGSIVSMPKFLGQGMNPSHSCDLRHSCSTMGTPKGVFLKISLQKIKMEGIRISEMTSIIITQDFQN